MVLHFQKWSTLTFVVMLLGVVDYLSGHELNFFVFYFVPVSFAGFYLGLVPSAIVSSICAIVWVTADILSGSHYSSPLFAVWNTGVRLIAFLSIGWAMSRIAVALAEQRLLVAKLTQTLAEIKILKSLLPICASCKKIRDDEGGWTQLERYIEDHTTSHFTHGLCPECAKQLLTDAGIKRMDQ